MEYVRFLFEIKIFWKKRKVEIQKKPTPERQKLYMMIV